VKSAEEIMEILEGFDLTSSYRDTAELAGCDHHTVARHVAAPEAGTLTADPATRVMVVDDIGLLPVGPDAAEGLYRLVDAAYHCRSVAVSSNLHPAGFDELMPKTLAAATVDRLLHHAHLCVTRGDSVRLSQATTGKGVVPLT
jgi:hypothetical protein